MGKMTTTNTAIHTKAVSVVRNRGLRFAKSSCFVSCDSVLMDLSSSILVDRGGLPYAEDPYSEISGAGLTFGRSGSVSVCVIASHCCS